MSYKTIKSRKNRDVIIFNKFLYHQFRINKNTTYYKSHHPKCHSSITIENSGTRKIDSENAPNNHIDHNKLEEIDIEMMVTIYQIKNDIMNNPNEQSST